jgi:hypothetical protein
MTDELERVFKEALIKVKGKVTSVRGRGGP